jgi:hypothetical protein
VPNGLDFADYQPPSAPPPTPPRLVFTGKLDYRPNVDAVLWFAESILPHIRAQQPPWSSGWLGNGLARLFGLYRAKTGYTLLGRCPIFNRTWRVRACLLRLCGWAVAHDLKLLEAFALERAVVGDSGWGGRVCGDRRGTAVSWPNTPQILPRLCLRSLADPNLQRHLGQRARQFGAQYYDWQAILPALWQCYRQLAIDQKLEPVG